jgi:hypothetical protein
LTSLFSRSSGFVSGMPFLAFRRARREVGA